MTITNIRAGHLGGDTHAQTAGSEHPARTDQVGVDAHNVHVGAGADTAAATPVPVPTGYSPLPPDTPNGHPSVDAQLCTAVGGMDTADPATADSPPRLTTPGSAGGQGPQAMADSQSRGLALADPTLALAADVLDDLERGRIANENRLRQLTRDVADADGEIRGFGLDESHPDVARLAGIVDGLAKLEHEATLNLQRAMRRHPLGPGVAAQRGVGEKQAARLLAAIGDPYWHSLEDRPRTVSELWAYAGLHTLPVGHCMPDTHGRSAGGDSAGGDHRLHDAQSLAVAARRKKGERANWSTAAKMRAYNIAQSMLKAGNREVYDRRKAATEGRVHAAPCVRCGPSGKPAQPGTSWSAAHRHADALRIVSKQLLKDLWRAARDIHSGGGQEVYQ